MSTEDRGLPPGGIAQDNDNVGSVDNKKHAEEERKRRTSLWERVGWLAHLIVDHIIWLTTTNAFYQDYKRFPNRLQFDLIISSVIMTVAVLGMLYIGHVLFSIPPPPTGIHSFGIKDEPTDDFPNLSHEFWIKETLVHLKHYDFQSQVDPQMLEPCRELTWEELQERKVYLKKPGKGEPFMRLDLVWKIQHSLIGRYEVQSEDEMTSIAVIPKYWEIDKNEWFHSALDGFNPCLMSYRGSDGFIKDYISPKVGNERRPDESAAYKLKGLFRFTLSRKEVFEFEGQIMQRYYINLRLSYWKEGYGNVEENDYYNKPEDFVALQWACDVLYGTTWVKSFMLGYDAV